MKTCPLCGNTMQEEDQFCTSCGNAQMNTSAAPDVAGFAPEIAAVPNLISEESADAATPALQHAQPQIPLQPVQPSQAQQSQPQQAALHAIPLPDLNAQAGSPPLFAGQQPSAAGMPGAPAVPQPPHAASPASSFQGAVPPVQPAQFAQAQPEASRPLYGGQPAYGQAQQNTYAPYGNGAVPPPPMQPGGMYQASPMPLYYQDETVGLGEWMLNYLIMVIPFVNIIMLCVWGFGSSAKPSVRNWARASLIWMGIGLVLAVLFIVVMAFLANSIFTYGLYDYYGY